MDGKNLTKLGLIAVALAAACYFGFKNSQAFTQENPDITTRKIWYLCGNEKCKNGFQVSVGDSREYSLSHPGQDVPCPKCGSADVQQAFQCPSCSKFLLPLGHGAVPKNCPHCKAALPPNMD